MTGHRADREDERPRRVQGECARNCFGRHVPDGSQMPGSCVHGEPRDAVMPAVGDVEELP